MQQLEAAMADQGFEHKRGGASGVIAYDTVEIAAAKLSCPPTALRARLRRAQRYRAGAVVADLGGGVYAFKLGRNWRVWVPRP